MEALNRHKGWIIFFGIAVIVGVWIWKPWVQPHEASAGEEYAVIEQMSEYYDVFAADAVLSDLIRRPSDREIVASAEEACATFRDMGMMWWYTLESTISRVDSGDPSYSLDQSIEWMMLHTEAVIIADTGFCPEADEAWNDYAEWVGSQALGEWIGQGVPT